MITIRHIRIVILLCFFLSGCAALIYEIVWMRMLISVFGATLPAVSTVLTVFMAGLALGSFISGRFADRCARPLFIYGLLEIAVGLYALMVPLLAGALHGIYGPIYHSYLENSFRIFTCLRFFLCFLLLVGPTTAMGATFPILCRFYTRSFGTIGFDVGYLYALNTTGAVLGSVLAGFFLLQTVGLKASTFVAAGLNLLIGSSCLLLSRQESVSSGEPDPVCRQKRRRSRWLDLVVLVGFAISGFASLAYEVAWTRVLSLVIGTTVYAYTLMLTAFLVGIALGSFVSSRFADRVRAPLLIFGVAEVLIGICALVMIFALDRLPFIFIDLLPHFSNFAMFQVVSFFLCFLVMVFPTILMGCTFPLVSRIYAHDFGEVGRCTGDIYSVNTLGCILGSFLMGFVLIPILSIQGSIILVAAVGIFLGVVLLFSERSVGGIGKSCLAGVTVAAVAALAWRMPVWDKVLLSSGIYTKPYLSKDLFARLPEEARLLYYKEGLNSTVSVLQFDRYKSFRIDGKTEASNLREDMANQLLLAHVPLILQKDPRNVLVVGLGAGTTAGSVARHPVDSIECIEIEEAVVGAARMFFRENDNILENPRFHLTIADARFFLLAGSHKYDVITSDPIHPFVCGAANLYTREYYQLCKDSLASEGIMCQWLPLFDMSVSDIKTIIRTFMEVFPHGLLWCYAHRPVTRANSILVGSPSPMKISFLRVSLRINRPGVRDDLAEIGVSDVFDFLTGFTMTEEDLARFSRDSRLHCDDRPVLEFSAPRGLFKCTAFTRLENFNMLEDFSGGTIPNLCDIEGSAAQVYRRLGEAYTVRQRLERAKTCFLKAEELEGKVRR